MNYLIAKLKNEFKSVLSRNNTIVDNISENSDEKIIYDPNHQLNEDEWFV